MKVIDPKALFFANPGAAKVYVETYGCQMNSSDSEVVVSILTAHGWQYTTDIDAADLILINTCAIREGAEQRIWSRLEQLRVYKKRKAWLLLGVIGCMAERLKEQLCQRQDAVDIIVGPDGYRSLPELVATASQGTLAINTELSAQETYAEIAPVRLDKNGVSAFVSIMRGCNNMCSYCVVPYTRGGERSRPVETILSEVKQLFQDGYREVTLLGQNVNSYKYEGVTFAALLSSVAATSPLLRVRFATSHPKDLSDQVIEVIARTPNICKAIHLPAQSGSTRMLELMNRKYTREWYVERINAIKQAMPDCSISTDIIAGFCGETLDDHYLTLSLMRQVRYEFAYMFNYSERPGTKAQRTMVDDVPATEKTRRLNEIIALQNELSLEGNLRDVGKTFEVLVEGTSKRSAEQLFGRTSQNKVVVFDRAHHKVGDYVQVNILSCSSATLLGQTIDEK